MKLASYFTSFAIFATLSLAQITPCAFLFIPLHVHITDHLPGSTTPSVRFRLAENTEACLGAVANAQEAEILLASCDSSNTIFWLPPGGPNGESQVVLTESLNGPILCITARKSLAGNTPVILDICEDDQWEHWRIGSGTEAGEIVSAVPTNGDYCLTAQHTGLGDPVSRSTFVLSSCSSTVYL